MNDESIFQNAVAQDKYGESYTHDYYVSKINQFTDEDGFKIPIYSYYVSNSNSVNNRLENFYSKVRINNHPDDKGGLLDLRDNYQLVHNLCKYTMLMIADKNPDGGNADGLRKAAKNLSFIS